MNLIFNQSATVTIEDKAVKILCDPWLVDGEYFGSWAQYPPYDFKPEKFDDIDFIYVSHIHPDHCGAKTLSKLQKKIPVLIHDFPQKFLKNYIESFGFNTIELEHDKRTHLKDDVYINILAADNCDPTICGSYFGCSFLESKFGATQIDTLSVIDNGNQVIVNSNDCPIEMARTAALKIKEKYKNIHMLLTGYAGALAFPQCFVDFEKTQLKEEMQKKKNRYLKQAEEYIKLFNPKYYLPFAGRYVLAGRYHYQNEERGMPELEEAFAYLSSKFQETKNKGIILNADTKFDLNSGESEKPYEKINLNEKEEYIKNVLSKYKYDFENEPIPSTDELMKLIPKAYQRFESKRIELNHTSDWKILVDISDTEMIAISCNGSGFKKIMMGDEEKNLKYLRFSVDLRLLKWLLEGPRKAHWNNAEIGSHIVFRRFPDVYERVLHYCFNWFYV